MHAQSNAEFELTLFKETFQTYDIVPKTQGNVGILDLSVYGTGFDDGTAIVCKVNETEAALTIAVSDEELKCEFNATELDPGTYVVSVAKGAEMKTVTSNVEILLVEMTSSDPKDVDITVDMVLPSVVGRHMPSTILVEVTNNEPFSVHAPLVRITGTDRALMTLDETLLGNGFQAFHDSQGFSDSVIIFASGERPGKLSPFEKVVFPVYYIGLSQPWILKIPAFCSKQLLLWQPILLYWIGISTA